MHSSEPIEETGRHFQGFVFEPRQVSFPYLWWSRARDFGLPERCRIKRPSPASQREETLVNVAARKLA